MKIQVHLTIQSDEGQAELVHELARLERGPSKPDTLGPSLAEARAILAGLERTAAKTFSKPFKGGDRIPWSELTLGLFPQVVAAEFQAARPRQLITLRAKRLTVDLDNRGLTAPVTDRSRTP